jgi:hypothetical protein
LRCDSHVNTQQFVHRISYAPFRRLWGDVRREFMQRFSVALHGTLGSFLRDSLHEGSDDAVACLLFLGLRIFPLFFFLLGGSFYIFL